MVDYIASEKTMSQLLECAERMSSSPGLWRERVISQKGKHIKSCRAGDIKTKAKELIHDEKSRPDVEQTWGSDERLLR